MGWNWSKKLRMMLWFRDSGVVLAFFYNFSYKNLSTGMEISRRGNHWQLIQVIGQAFSESWIDTWEFYKSTRQRLNISLSFFDADPCFVRVTPLCSVTIVGPEQRLWLLRLASTILQMASLDSSFVVVDEKVFSALSSIKTMTESKSDEPVGDFLDVTFCSPS